MCDLCFMCNFRVCGGCEKCTVRITTDDEDGCDYITIRIDNGCKRNLQYIEQLQKLLDENLQLSIELSQKGVLFIRRVLKDE